MPLGDHVIFQSVKLAVTAGKGLVSLAKSREDVPSLEVASVGVSESIYDWTRGKVLDYNGLSMSEALLAAAAGVWDCDEGREKRLEKERLRLEVAVNTAGADPPESLLEGGPGHGKCMDCTCLKWPVSFKRGKAHITEFNNELARIHLACDTKPSDSQLILPFWKLLCSRSTRPKFGAFVFYSLAHGVRFMSEETLDKIPPSDTPNGV